MFFEMHAHQAQICKMPLTTRHMRTKLTQKRKCHNKGRKLLYMTQKHTSPATTTTSAISVKASTVTTSPWAVVSEVTATTICRRTYFMQVSCFITKKNDKNNEELQTGNPFIEVLRHGNWTKCLGSTEPKWPGSRGHLGPNGVQGGKAL